MNPTEIQQSLESLKSVSEASSHIPPLETLFQEYQKSDIAPDRKKKIEAYFTKLFGEFDGTYASIESMIRDQASIDAVLNDSRAQTGAMKAEVAGNNNEGQPNPIFSNTEDDKRWNKIKSHI